MFYNRQGATGCRLADELLNLEIWFTGCYDCETKEWLLHGFALCSNTGTAIRIKNLN